MIMPKRSVMEQAAERGEGMPGDGTTAGELRARTPTRSRTPMPRNRPSMDPICTFCQRPVFMYDRALPGPPLGQRLARKLKAKPPVPPWARMRRRR